LKKILSVFLALTIVSQVLLNVGLSVYYHLNKTYITQKLCENKNNPSIHCNGHCYLTKQLKKAEEGEKNSATKVLKEKEEIFSNSTANLPGVYFPAYTVAQIRRLNTQLYISDNEDSLLKPPTV
jgi:hypothetical protein